MKTSLSIAHKYAAGAMLASSLLGSRMPAAAEEKSETEAVPPPRTEAFLPSLQYRLEPLVREYPADFHGYSYTFKPIAFEADPFSRNLASIETRVSLLQSKLERTTQVGSWTFERGVREEFLIKQSFGLGTRNEAREEALQPNFIGPRVEMWEKLLHPIPCLQTTDDGSWCGHFFSKPTYLDFHFREGTELHMEPLSVQPYYRAMIGLQKDFPIRFMGKERTLTLELGPQMEGTLGYPGRLSPLVDFNLKF